MVNCSCETVSELCLRHRARVDCYQPRLASQLHARMRHTHTLLSKSHAERCARKKVSQLRVHGKKSTHEKLEKYLYLLKLDAVDLKINRSWWFCGDNKI